MFNKLRCFFKGHNYIWRVLKVENKAIKTELCHIHLSDIMRCDEFPQGIEVLWCEDCKHIARVHFFSSNKIAEWVNVTSSPYEDELKKRLVKQLMNF